MKRIGCLTFHASHNYGSVLQAYALQTFIKRHMPDSEFEIINLRLPAQKQVYAPIRKKGGILCPFRILSQLTEYKSRRKKFARFEDFIATYLNLSAEYSSEEEIERRYDIYLAGGDQIWNTACKDFSWAYYLESFASKKISFAPSMGPHPSFSGDEKNRIAHNLALFDVLCVREAGTQKIAQELLSASGVQKTVRIMPDPVLLLSASEWDFLCQKSAPVHSGGPFILFYSLGCTNETYTFVKKIGAFLHKKIIITRHLKLIDYIPYYKKCFDTGPLEFLSLLKASDMVVATSFHACVFAALFHKPFVALDVQDDNRIQGFLNHYGLGGHSFLSQKDSFSKLEQIALLRDFDCFELEVKLARQTAEEWIEEVKAL